MYAIEVSTHGGPEVLEYTEVPDPEPGIGELLVRPARVGVNYIDTYFREGIYSTDLPYIPGSEGAGVVVTVGSGVTRFRPGDRVAWCNAPSSYAEYVRVPAAAAVAVPEGISDSVAASALLQGLTAHYLLHDTHRAQPGDYVLVHAGAGGVGQLLVQMASRAGYHVIATTSTAQKAEIVRSLGARHVVYYEDATVSTLRHLSDGGVVTAFDGVGKTTFDTSLASLRPRGTLVAYGAASGPIPPFDVQRLNSGGSLFLTRPTLAHYIATREELEWRAGDVFGALASGELSLQVGAEFALSQAAEAHRALEARQTVGSIVLDPLG